MSKHFKRAGFALTALVLSVGFTSSAAAGAPARGRAKIQAQPVQVVEVVETVTVLKGEEPVEELIAPGLVQGPHILYRDHGPQRLKRCGTITVDLSIQDPCNGCVYAIPVCLPECCSDAPRAVVERAGPRGGAVGVYVWRCGYKVKMILDRSGEIITVHTIGR